MKFNHPKAKRKLDKLFSELILNRCQRTCERCGRSGLKVDCSHTVPREVLILRWNEDNACGLCVSCHKWGLQSLHKNPLAFYQWFEGKYSYQRVKELLRISELPYKFNQNEYERILHRLESKLLSQPHLGRSSQ